MKTKPRKKMTPVEIRSHVLHLKRAGFTMDEIADRLNRDVQELRTILRQPSQERIVYLVLEVHVDYSGNVPLSVSDIATVMNENVSDLKYRTSLNGGELKVIGREVLQSDTVSPVPVIWKDGKPALCKSRRRENI